ncbi:hypothetical protein [uncultured Methanobacterium sp.]|uniref:hypothetical protein n=1 Tax=uncultured Methanobacterium sp. TaxID=176306 RepID=UPI002AA8AD3B|nr:hypothetical protein [uncultured Methanobacterium sp.]
MSISIQFGNLFIKHKGGETIRKQAITYRYMILLLLITLTILFCASTVSANEIYVNTTGNDTTGNGTAENPYLTIQQGMTNVEPNGTIRIANGQYSGENNTNLIINKNMTIIGESQEKTIINGTDTNGIFQIQRGITVTIENLTLSNGYKQISGYYTEGNGGAILNLGNLTVTNCTFTNNYAHSPSWSYYTVVGGAISNSNDGPDSVTCTVTGCNFTNNTADEGGAISNVNSGAGSVTCTVTGCNFTNNTAYEGGAIYNSCYVGKGLNLATGYVTCTVTGSNFTNNTADYGGAIENSCIAYSNSGLLTCNVRECNFNGENIYNRRYIDGGLGSVIFTANFNRFFNNQATVIINQDNPTSFVDIENNWWGTNNPDFDSLISGINTPTYWLFMTINSTPSTINNTQNSLITVSFNNHSLDGTSSSPLDPTNDHIPDVTPVTFSFVWNPLGTLTEPLTVVTSNGTASILFTANTIGVQQIKATTDNQDVSTHVTINPASFVDITNEFRDLPWGSVITTAYYNDKIYAIVEARNLGPDSTSSVNVQDLLNGLTWTGNYYVLRTVGSYPSNNKTWEFNDPQYPFNGTDWNVGSLSTTIGSERWLAIEVTVNRTGTASNYAETVDQSSYPYKGYANYTAYLTANDRPTSITVNDVNGNKGDTVTLKAVLTDYLGNPLAGKAVKFWIDQVEVGQNITDSTGTALFNYIISQSPGNHTLTATFNETNYQESNATGSLYVPTANLYLEITSDKNNPTVGETFTLTYKLGNYGPDTADNVTVIIPVPEGFHILQIYGDGDWTVNANGTITWTFNNVKMGDPYLHLYGYASGDEDILFTGSIFSDTYNKNTIGVKSLTVHAIPPETPEVNAATNENMSSNGNTIGMQTTGAPVVPLALTVISVLGGLAATRKKQ